MEYSSFEEMYRKVRGFRNPRRVVLTAAEDEHGLEAVFAAQQEGFVYPVLVGNKTIIEEMVAAQGFTGQPHTIVDNPEDKSPAQTAVELINAGEGHFLMKGLIETKDFLRPVVDKANNLNTGNIMCHFCFAQIPNYPKLIVMTDAGVVMNPTVDEKRQIIGNAVATLRQMGYERPKVALINAVEVVNPKMQDTVDAAELVNMWKDGKIPDCDLAGPMSYDLAVDRESALIKGFDCLHSGNFDVLVSPNMVTGNILIKCWAYTAGGTLAGIIVGAKVPIILASRSTSKEGKMVSLVLAAAVSAEGV